MGSDLLVRCSLACEAHCVELARGEGFEPALGGPDSTEKYVVATAERYLVEQFPVSQSKARTSPIACNASLGSPPIVRFDEIYKGVTSFRSCTHCNPRSAELVCSRFARTTTYPAGRMSIAIRRRPTPSLARTVVRGVKCICWAQSAGASRSRCDRTPRPTCCAFRCEKWAALDRLRTRQQGRRCLMNRSSRSTQFRAFRRRAGPRTPCVNLKAAGVSIRAP